VISRLTKTPLKRFHAGLLSWPNWNLERGFFVEEGKPENPEKYSRSKAKTNNKLNPHVALVWNQARATLVRGERSHHRAIPASQIPSNDYCQVLRYALN